MIGDGALIGSGPYGDATATSKGRCVAFDEVAELLGERCSGFAHDWRRPRRGWRGVRDSMRSTVRRGAECKQKQRSDGTKKRERKKEETKPAA
ncbi:hypothetical protein ANO11243_056590 [Dothideomycetidae sp. 11243]|nr:hypothetical protein ANO11243_056590 [fungal sp. No.11243]